METDFNGYEDEENSALFWTAEDVVSWAAGQNLHADIIECLSVDHMNGNKLLSMTEQDIKRLNIKFASKIEDYQDIKQFWIALKTLKKENATFLTTTRNIKSESESMPMNKKMFTNNMISLDAIENDPLSNDDELDNTKFDYEISEENLELNHWTQEQSDYMFKLYTANATGRRVIKNKPLFLYQLAERINLKFSTKFSPQQVENRYKNVKTQKNKEKLNSVYKKDKQHSNDEDIFSELEIHDFNGRADEYQTSTDDLQHSRELSPTFSTSSINSVNEEKLQSTNELFRKYFKEKRRRFEDRKKIYLVLAKQKELRFKIKMKKLDELTQKLENYS